MATEFNSYREFNNKFPTKLYICPMCNSLSDNPYQCPFCKCQSNNFLIDNKFTYKINSKTNQIFNPIELLRKEENEKNSNYRQA